MPRAIDKHPQKRGVGASIFNPLRSGIASYEDPMSAIQNDMSQIGGPFRKLFSMIGSIFGLPSPEEIVAGVANGIGQVIAGATDFVAGVGQFFAKLVGGFIDAIQIPLLDPSKVFGLPGLNTKMQDFLDALAHAFGGAASGNDVAAAAAAANDLAEKAEANEATQIAIQLQLQLLQAPAGTPPGMVHYVDIVGNEGDALNPTDWGASQPAAGNLLVRGTSVPTIGIPDALPVGLYWVPSQYVQTSDNHQFEAIVYGTGKGTQLPTYLLFNSDAAYTAGGYLKVTDTALVIGKYTRAGTNFTFTPLPGGTAAKAISSGTRVEVFNDVNDWAISANNVVLLTVTDSTTIPRGPGNVHNAVALSRGNIVINSGTPWAKTTVGDSFRISSVLLSDYWAGSNVTPSWLLTRASTSAAALTVANGAAAALPATFLSANVYDVGVTVQTLATGIVKIDTAGMYEMSYAGFSAATKPTARYMTAWCLMLNGAQVTGPIPSGETITLPLDVADTVQPGICGGTVLSTAANTDSDNVNGSSSSNSIGPYGVAVAVANVYGFASWTGRLISAA